MLTYATIGAFIGYLGIAVALNIIDNRLLAEGEQEIEAAETTAGVPVPTEALETVPLDAVPGVGVTPAASENVVTPLAPIGSDENDLPGQE